jgi:hypothetical protein
VKRGFLALFVVLSLFIMPLVAGPTLAGVEPAPWLPTTGGFDNPIFWVAFNPQPEPPGAPYRVNVNTSTDPNALVFRETYGGTDPAQLFFGIGATDSLVGRSITSSIIGGDTIRFEVFRPVAGAPNQLEYTANINFEAVETGGFLFPGSLVAFNPQPEPPGIPFYSLVSFNLLFPSIGSAAPLPLTSGSLVDMTLRLTDAQGNPIALQSVPEPGTMMLLGSGLVGLIGYGRKRLKKGNPI